ncbi:MAG: hypothetical protein AB1345_02340 [Chloroflexota bacterium]
MNNKPVLLVIYGLSAICLIIGSIIGFKSCLPTPPPPPNAETLPTQTPSLTYSYRYLLIGTDTANPLTARLKSTWLITYIPSQDQIWLNSLYPTSPDSPLAQESSELPKVFLLDSNKEVSAEFLDALPENVYPFETYFVIDDSGFARLIDILGGLPKGEEILPGVRVIGNLTPPWVDLLQAWIDQQSLFQSICEHFNNTSIAKPVHSAEEIANHISLFYYPPIDQEKTWFILNMLVENLYWGRLTCSFVYPLPIPTSNPH